MRSKVTANSIMPTCTAEKIPPGEKTLLYPKDSAQLFSFSVKMYCVSGEFVNLKYKD